MVFLNQFSLGIQFQKKTGQITNAITGRLLARADDSWNVKRIFFAVASWGITKVSSALKSCDGLISFVTFDPIPYGKYRMPSESSNAKSLLLT
jgi:hypothetical protein